MTKMIRKQQGSKAMADGCGTLAQVAEATLGIVRRGWMSDSLFYWRDGGVWYFKNLDNPSAYDSRYVSAAQKARYTRQANAIGKIDRHAVSMSGLYGAMLSVIDANEGYEPPETAAQLAGFIALALVRNGGATMDAAATR